jgi:hypothetical protein
MCLPFPIANTIHKSRYRIFVAVELGENVNGLGRDGITPLLLSVQ